MKSTNSLYVSMILYMLLASLLVGCQPQLPADPDPTWVAASVEAYFTQQPMPTDDLAETPHPTPTDEPKTLVTAEPAAPLLPAPLYFLSGEDAAQQIWRIEMNGGFAHPVTDLPAPVDDFDLSPVDGRLAFVSGNDLFIAGPDGSNPQMIVNGPDVDAQQGFDPEITLGSPLWSPDGKELAFSLNGVNVINLENGNVRTLITNVVSGVENVAQWRSYYPLYWSPEGGFLAAQVGYYEGTGLTILPGAGGNPIDPQLFVCCDIVQAEDSGAFYLASAMLAYGEPGFWKVEWQTGKATRLSAEAPDSGIMPTYAHPLLAGQNLYFFTGIERSTSIARSSMANPDNVEIVMEFPYFPQDALWSPDASLVVAAGRRPDLPMQVWWLSGEQRTLEVTGSNLKWGVPTAADLAIAATPAPPPTPVVIPTLPANAQPLTAANLDQLETLAVIDRDEEVYSLALSPDGRLLALGLSNRVHLWDLTSMQKVAILKPYRDIIPALDFSPDSRYLAVGSWDKSLDLWEMGAYQKVRSFTGHQDFIAAVRFSPDGRNLASASSDLSLRVWDVATGALARAVTMDRWVSDVDYTPDGSLMAFAAWERDTLIVEASSGREIGRVTRPAEQWALDLAFSPDGQTLVLGAWNYDIVLYDLAAMRERAILPGHGDNPTGMAFTADGQVLASVDEGGELRFWDLSSGALLHQIKGTRILAISQDGRLLVTGGERIEGVVLWYVPF